MQIINLQNMEDRWLTAKDAMKWLGISRSSFYRMIQVGKLPKPQHPLSPHMPRWLMSDLVSFLSVGDK
jgi:predicted DNA-binding transcriptional regulator AlpA